ncbi:hypothetical protein ACH0B6_20545 [Solibacillus silvestris]
MKINPNFVIERSSSNKLFLSNRKNCKGYYINLNQMDEKQLTTEKIDSLISIGFYEEEKYKKPHFINNLISFKKGINEKVLLRINILLMILGTIITLITIYWAWPVLNSMSTVTIEKVEFLKAILIFMAGLIIIHEMFHVISARMQLIEVYSIWFKLKYYFIPIFYVKIVPTGNDIKRANIAFAGNVADLLLIVTYSCALMITEQPYWSVVLIFQIVMSIFNYNILFPTDFYLGLFSGIGKATFRVKAIKFTKEWISRKVKIEGKQNVFQLIYGLAFYSMLLTFLCSMIWNMSYWIR